MRNFTKQDLRTAQKNAQSYREFKSMLEDLGNRVPKHADIPSSMRGWGRKLRYEVSQDPHYGTPTTGHDIRQARYYDRLERLGHPNPIAVMGNNS